jgi:hypothetical protein
MKNILIALVVIMNSSAAFAEIRTADKPAFVKTGKVAQTLVCADVADTASGTEARLKKKVRHVVRHHELVEVSTPIAMEKQGQLCVTVKYNEKVQKAPSTDLFKQKQQT